MKLAILICHLPERKGQLERLMWILAPQIVRSTKIIIRSDERGTMTTGAKRNALLDEAAEYDAEYACFIDDDDWVDPSYVRLILQSIAEEKDVVGFKTRRFVDGKQTGDAVHSIRYQRSQTLQYGDWTRYERVPNHLNPVRMKLALATRFADITYGEDHDYANRLRPLLKTESFIDEYLYDYLLIRAARKWPFPLCPSNTTSLASTP